MTQYNLNPEHFASVHAELADLFSAAYAESEMEKKFPLEPDYEQYVQLEAMGMLKLYVLRKDDEPIGFGLYLLSTSLHHTSAMFAMNDSIFLSPAERHGDMAAAMVTAIDTDLRSNGASSVTYQMRPGCSFTTLMQSAGYHQTATVWVKD